VVILPKTGATREFINVRERRTFDPVAADTAALVSFLSASTDTLNVTVTGPTTVTFSNFVYRASSGYRSLKPGNYTAEAKKDTTVVATTSFSVTLQKRYTDVIMGSGTAVAIKHFVDE
jgi:hypothetical protein